MTGKSDGWLLPRPAQPGGRAPAPGSLALVQSFINSHYDLDLDRGADLFATPGTLRDWLLARRLITARTAVTSADLDRARAVREGLRELARARSGNDSSAARRALSLLNGAGAGAAVEVCFSHDGPRFVLAADDGARGAIGLVLGLTAQAMLDGSWARLKICPGDHCGWAFFDHSRNQTGRWCSMSICGARAKARAHYRRRRGGE